MSDASEAARRRREIRQKKILENSGQVRTFKKMLLMSCTIYNCVFQFQRLGKILGAPPEAAASLAAEDG